MGIITHPVRTVTHPVAAVERQFKQITQPFVKGTVALGHAIGLGGVADKAAKSLYNYDPAAKAASAAALGAADAANDAVAGDRKRRRIGSALATGASDSGTAPTTSAMAYGKPTLG